MQFQKQCNVLYVLAIIGLGVFALKSQAIKQIAPSTPSVVVSVDIERVFSSLEERAFEMANVQSLIRTMNNDLEQRRQHIDSFEQEFELYQTGSEKWNELLQEQQLAVLEYEAQVEYTRRRALREESKGMRRVYTHIKDAAERLANENGWDYVFVNDSIVALPESDNVDMGAQISSRRLLYANQTMDVTDVMIEHMNASFDEMAVR